MDVKKLVEEMNNMILNGKVLEAFEKFYADDIIMQENQEEPRKGKQSNREFEKQFVENIKEFHGAEVKSVSIGKCGKTGNDLTSVEWEMDISFKDGNRVKTKQVAVQRWNDDGKIVMENFYYNKG